MSLELFIILNKKTNESHDGKVYTCEEQIDEAWSKLSDEEKSICKQITLQGCDIKRK